MKKLTLALLFVASVASAGNINDSMAPFGPQYSYRPTYIASISGQATTAAIILSIESSATLGFKISRICVASTPATAAAAVTVTVQRRNTAASSGGTALTADGTGTTAISRLDLSDAAFGGIARQGGTPGTAGAVLDQWGWTVGELGAGVADPPSEAPICQTYGLAGSKPLVAPIGVLNGISINVSAAGAGGLASGTISVEFTAD